MALKSGKGPSVGKANMYYNYYETQTMKRYGRREWKDWPLYGENAAND